MNNLWKNSGVVIAEGNATEARYMSAANAGRFSVKAVAAELTGYARIVTATHINYADHPQNKRGEVHFDLAFLPFIKQVHKKYLS